MKKLKVMTILGTRPEIIRLSAVIKACDKYFSHILVHTGQNWDYRLYKIFFEELNLRMPDYFLESAGKNLGETIGNIISKSYDILCKEMLLKPALHYGLHIYDRKYNYTLHDYYKFPDDYKSCIRGYLSPEQMYSAYKKYDIFLNVNTVKDSPSMFSRRIFELLACGTNVVSNYSQGLEKMFPAIVKLSKNKEDTAQHLEFLLGNEAERDKLSLKGLRNVLKEHTCTHRLNDILDKTGICRRTVENGSVSIITCTNKDGFINNVFKNYAAQSYKEKELIIILNGSSLNLEKWLEKAAFYKNIKVFRLDGEKTLGECLNFAVEKSGCQYIAKFDDDDYYAPEYLGDLVNCFKYTDADIAGKYSYYCYLKELRILAVRFPGLENLYSDFLSGATMVAKRKVFDRVRFKCLQKGTDTQFYRDCLVNGIRLYSSDRFNYVCVRGANSENHTWKIGHEEFLEKCSIASCTDRYEEYVTV